MKNKILATSIAIGLFSLCAHAFDAEVTPSVNLNFASSFVANGITWVDGPVLMPSATLAVDSGDHHTSFTYWTCLNLDDTRGYDNPESAEGEMSEWDVMADYTYTGFEFVDLSAGAVHYVFPRLGDAYTSDVYVKAALKTLLNPALTLMYDVDGGNSGFHGDLGISESIDLECGITLGAWAKMVMADGDYGAAYYSDDGESFAGIMSLGTGLTASYALSENVSLAAGLSYWNLQNDDGVCGMTHGEWEAMGIESPADNVSGNISVNFAF